jgi:hypothetical protein
MEELRKGIFQSGENNLRGCQFLSILDTPKKNDGRLLTFDLTGVSESIQ